MKEYMTVQEASKKWRISVRRVQILCSKGRVLGAEKYASVWAIPSNTPKPQNQKSGPKKE